MRPPRKTFSRLFLASLLTMAYASVSAETTIRQLQAACQPDSATSMSLDKIQVRKFEAGPGDLAYYEARSAATGSSVRLYHEADLDAAAASKAACLMGMLDLLSAGLPHLRGAVVWSPIVLTHDVNYIPPKRDGELRWATVFRSTTWEPENLHFLLDVMPHEETHLSQAMGGERLPRWFAEGHAEWASLQVTEQVNPVLAASARARRAEEARKLGQAQLGAWGGIRVKPEAIERQLSAADRERRARDPDFVPSGPYNFDRATSSRTTPMRAADTARRLPCSPASNSGTTGLRSGLGCAPSWKARTPNRSSRLPARCWAKT
jgi:hypothetical protein